MNSPPSYVLCVNHGGYPASLEVRKVYRTMDDPSAVRRGFLRIIDESGEDYLYPAGMFYKLELPVAVRQAVFRAA